MMFDFPDGWKLQSVEDSMKAIIDYRGKTPRKTPSGVPLITAKIVKDGRIMTPTEFIAAEGYDSWMNRGLPEPGDVVMTTEAPLGEIAQLDNRKVALGQRLITLRGRPELLNNTYLKFAMQAAFVQNQLKARSTGTTVLGISQRELREVEIPLPPLSEQHRIAHILGTLDEKIELNRQMNENLEATARAIFKSWFVDFDPVKAKVEGHKPACLDTETADLFPSTFQDSPLEKIPEGWAVEKIGNLVEIVKGRSYRSNELKESDVALVTLKSIMRGGGYHPDGLKPYTGKYNSAQVITPGELVVSYTDVTQEAEVVGKPAIVRGNENYQTLVASLDLGIIRPLESTVSVWFLYCLFRERRFQSHIYGYADGTTVLHLSKDGVPRYQFALPPEKIRNLFDSVAEPFFAKIESNENESHTLAQTRDTLLPKLLSGEVRVDDAAEILEVTCMPQQTVPNIELLHVKNYRALRNIKLKQLKPLTVFLGANGSGKSTFFDVFAFLAECFTDGLRRAWDKRGRFKELRSRGCDGQIEFELKYREEPKSPIITYHLSIDEDIKGPFVDTEWLQWRPSSQGRHTRFLDFHRGVGSVIAGETPNEEDEQINEQLDDPSVLAVNMFGQLTRHPRVSALRRFITDWHLSYLSADATRGITEAGPQERLSETGDNLPNVIQHLKEQYPERLEKILAVLSDRVPRLEKVETELTVDGHLVLQIKDAPFDQPILAKFASDGTLKLLSYLTLLYDPEPPQLIGIEEPENYLHPRLLTGLVGDCLEASASSQLMITTHSPRFVNELSAEEVWVLYRDEEGFTVCKRASDMLGVEQLLDAGAKLGKLWMEGYFEFGDPLTNAGGPKRELHAH